MTKPTFLSNVAIEISAVGSRVSCDPPPTDTDEDWLVLVRKDDIRAAIDLLNANGYYLDNPNTHYAPDSGDFNSWRDKDNINLIVTYDEKWHKLFLIATEAAKELNLMKKEQRVALFQAILYGNYNHG